ncbi:amylosucrase [Rubrivivax rivuli]|uniref:Amylosucrase n=1 Tax=Rubrivivax rivuli TaxID=1862385 RepID=A0A437RRU9_9BURK|nr:amylosucrase [Rubrivivax rivuli]RVU49352.1 amylosucrase [Rubrivivax rivuli]
MLHPQHQTRLLVAHAQAALQQQQPQLQQHAGWPAFQARLQVHLPVLAAELHAVYGERADFLDVLGAAVLTAWQGWCERSAALRALDAQREHEPPWFTSERAIGAVCYADLWAGGLAGVRERVPYLRELGVTYLHVMPPFQVPEGPNDGGYAVSSYREVNPRLGSMADLRGLAEDLRRAGISLVLDFVFNHTASDHAWARACAAGQPGFEDFYIVYPDRAMPDAYERTVREIFPDEHAGAFSQLPDGRWIWTTFHSYQWDLNYANPHVFNAMAGEMLAIANLGVEALRLDAVAFIWKRLGTSCENLPEAHHLIRAFNALARLAAPSLVFKSEAIVHPDDVLSYIGPHECQISYNPLQMALLWNSLATREVNLLQAALSERHALPEGTAWVNYVRSHDDIGWTFADEDAERLGIRGHDHRQFLNRFYVNRHPGSFARGVPFQDNPATGDCRVSGTCASLCGLEQRDVHAVARILLLHGVAFSSGGLPLVYLGDELGQLNDHGYLQDPARAGDSRWVHRPAASAQRFAERLDAATDAGRIFAGFQRLVAARQQLPGLRGGALVPFHSGNPHVLGYLRGQGAERVLVLGNFSEHPQRIDAAVFSAGPAQTACALGGTRHTLRDGLGLAPYALLWLRYPET